MKVIQTSKKKKGKTLTLHQLNWLEYVSIGMCLWFVFYPKPYQLLLIVLLLLPFIGMYLNGLEKPCIASLVEINRGSKNEYDVADFIDLPAWAILIRVLVDYETDSFVSILLAGSVALVAICIFLFITHEKIRQSNKDKWWIYSSIFFSFFVYSFSAVIAVNCSFDTSEPQVYETTVIDKYISRGKHTNYYIKVKPWGHHYDVESIRVPSSDYSNYQVNQKTMIDYKEGLLGIPWYYLE